MLTLVAAHCGHFHDRYRPVYALEPRRLARQPARMGGLSRFGNAKGGRMKSRVSNTRLVGRRARRNSPAAVEGFQKAVDSGSEKVPVRAGPLVHFAVSPQRGPRLYRPGPGRLGRFSAPLHPPLDVEGRAKMTMPCWRLACCGCSGPRCLCMSIACGIGD